MKQQIKELINGVKDIIRKDDEPKYKNANQATSHIGFAGTDRKTRDEVAHIVSCQNPQQMTVQLCGKELKLKRWYSVSGKGWMWSCEIEEELASLFVSTYGNMRSYTLVVYQDCTVAIHKYVRKNQESKWKASKFQYIDEAFLIIL